MKIKTFSNLFIVGFAVFALNTATFAQFNSGSTGADGALDLSTMNCPNNTCEVQLPESGVLNYTTVNIPENRTLRFKTNSRNTPATLLAQGQIVVAGYIDVSTYVNIITSCYNVGPPLMGPGGFRSSQNGSGFGPGGGTPSDPNGKWVGPLSLTPLVGGSGAYAHTGGGGGAILLASSTSITVSGQILALGSECGGFVAYGSGGAIRLVANTINASGSFRGCTQNRCGVVRLEATSMNFTGQSAPAAVLSPINSNTSTSNLPQLTIASVGGFAVPAYAGARFDTVDILLPNSLSDPLAVAISANNIPPGTQVVVGFPSSAGGSSAPCTLTGTQTASSCTASVSGLNRTAVTYLLATAAFAPPASLAEYNPPGKDQISKVEIQGRPGQRPEFRFLNAQNHQIPRERVNQKFLSYFDAQ